MATTGCYGVVHPLLLRMLAAVDALAEVYWAVLVWQGADCEAMKCMQHAVLFIAMLQH